MPATGEPKAWKRHAAQAPLYAAALILAYFFISAASWWVGAVKYPYALENGEGWVLASAVELSEGRSPYGTLDDYPMVVGNYPPLYIMANAGAIRLWGFSPIYGRVLSLAAWAVGVVLIILAARRLEVSWTAAFLGGLYALAIPGMKFVAPQVRVDVLAATLSLGGLVWLLWREESPAVVGPAVFFAAALATKHSAVAAPAVAFVWLVWRDRPRALRLALLTAGLTLGWLAACWAFFGKEFFLNIGPYTAAIPWAWKNFYRIWRLALGVWYLPALAAVAGYAAWALPRGGMRDRLVALYGLAAVGTALTVAKEGSSLLYLMELTFAGSLALACALGRLLETRKIESPFWRFGACLLVAGGLFFLQFPVQGYPIGRRLAEARRSWSYDWEGLKKRDELMISIVRRAPGPVLAEEPFYLLAAGKRVLFNPFIMKWMAKSGRWDEQRLVRDLAGHRFSMIQLNGFAVPPSGRALQGPERNLHALTRARFSPQVLRGIDLWYELIRPLRDYPFGKVYVPK